MPSQAEILLAAQLEQAGIGYATEVQFSPPRKYRADFAVAVDDTAATLLVEIEGGTWVEGRHTRGAGFESGTEKQYLALKLGYRYLRVTTEQVENGTALRWIRELLAEAA